MTADNRLGDRRAHLRFDITLQLWASLDLREPVVLRNVAAKGALVEARLTPRTKSLRVGQVRLRESGPELTAVVRHRSPLTSAPDEERYLIGLEFVHLSTSERVELEEFVREWQERTGTP
jgi:hypothetical protein